MAVSISARESPRESAETLRGLHQLLTCAEKFHLYCILIHAGHVSQFFDGVALNLFQKQEVAIFLGDLFQQLDGEIALGEAFVIEMDGSTEAAAFSIMAASPSEKSLS